MLTRLILVFECIVFAHSLATALNAHVIPSCGSQLISIEIIFDPEQLPGGKFQDWIIVGVSGRQECRLKGNGETKYIIEIAVFNDPCLTEVPARNVFQNKIRIGKNPIVILQEDQTVMVKCVYGLPTVETVTLPVITSNFNIENNEKVSNVKEILDQAPEHITHFEQPNVVSPVSIFEEVATTTITSIIPVNGDLSDTSFIAMKPEKPQSSSFSLKLLSGIILFLLLATILFCIFLFFLKRRSSTRNNRLLEARTPGPTHPIRFLKKSNKQTVSPREDNEQSMPRGKISPRMERRLNHNNTFQSYTTKQLVESAPKKPTPDLNVPLKSNLAEFVSKTHALDEYNSLASPTYAYGSELFEEREVDIPVTTSHDRQVAQFNNHKSMMEENVSSFKSITEIVHSAETADVIENYSTKSHSNEADDVLKNSVNRIRGFGHRKLTEQEIIRWKNLIQQDFNIKSLLYSAKSLAEIETIFEHDEYRNLFTASKWHEISVCVHRALTNSLDRSNSQAELHIFVGNVNTDW